MNKTVVLTLGQDTACYASHEIVVPEEILNDPEALEAHIKAQANSIMDDLVFEPEYDFSSPRIVSAMVGQEMIAEDVPLGPRYYDAGLLLHTAIKEKNWEMLFNAAKESGASQKEIMSFLVKFGPDI